MKRTTVMLVDDHMIVREGFRKMLELEEDLEVVGEAQNGREAISMAQALLPAVVLMDLAMPQLNGLEATRQILAVTPATKILILSAHNDDAYVLNALDSGAAGFLLKQSSAHEVCRAIREVQGGKAFFSPEISKRFVRLRAQVAGRERILAKLNAELTSREMEVLQMIAEGEANKQIASTLGISIKTVEKHRARLMTKLDIHDTAGLTRYAIAAGIIESSVQVTVL